MRGMDRKLWTGSLVLVIWWIVDLDVDVQWWVLRLILGGGGKTHLKHQNTSTYRFKSRRI
jgi:hypothetical protein